MRHFLIFLIVAVLLTGCSASTTEPTTELIPSTVPETTIPTVVTEPPDPLQMLLDAMTVEEKVGQLFLARCPSEGALEDVSQYHLGGYILFGQDFDNETPDSFRHKIAAYQDASPIPLLIAVDEEIGRASCRERV